MLHSSSGRQRDLVHARCSASADRRLQRDGWLTLREVEVVTGRCHGWVDLLAFDPRTHTLRIVEIKTRLDDVGALERQVAWYEREAHAIARRHGWVPRRVVTWALVLASDEVDATIAANRDLLHQAVGGRPPAMAADHRRALALIDPSDRGRRWLHRPRVDGRRSPAPYRDDTDAARRFAAVA